MTGGPRDTVHPLAVLGTDVLRHSALEGMPGPASSRDEAGMCLSGQSGPRVAPVLLREEVISGILKGKKGQPAARVTTSVLNRGMHRLIYSSSTFQKPFTEHQGYPGLLCCVLTFL